MNRSGLLLLCLVACARGAPPSATSEDDLRKLERTRLSGLVQADTLLLDQLHADDFELINPYGEHYGKADYLGQVANGQLDYVAWEAGEIVVRLYDDVAALRYQDRRFEARFDGEIVSEGQLYHTNVYELRAGRWQLVWSHASGGF